MTADDARRPALQSALREARQRAGLTQAEVADKLRMPQSYVSKFEVGTRRLDLVELVDVCAVLGIEIQDLVAVVDKSESEQ